MQNTPIPKPASINFLEIKTSSWEVAIKHACVFTTLSRLCAKLKSTFTCLLSFEKAVNNHTNMSLTFS